MRVMLLDDLTALEAEWSSLFESDPLATPFASFEWLSVWCRHWGAGGRPWILAVYDGERLAGLAPLLLRRRGGLRFLTGLGVGVGNYWDVITAPDDRPRVLTLVAETLQKHSSEWDAFFMDKLPEESSTQTALQEARLRLDRVTRLSSPRIELPDSFDDYLVTVSSKRRNEMRRSLRMIDSGELTIRKVSGSNELRAAVASCQDFKVDWWEKRGLAINPDHGSHRFLAFTNEVLAAMVPRELATVWEMRYRDELMGISINLLDNTAFYGWLFGFDFRLEELRPGHTLIAYAIRWSIQTRRRYFDFMLGAESYKYHYAPVDRTVVSATVGSQRLRSRATLGLSRLRHAVLPAGLRVPVFGRSI